MSVVLALDANQRSALAVVRSLGRLGSHTLLAADSTTSALAGSSKYCAQYLKCPCSATQPLAFLEWVKQYVSENGVDYIFPTTEITSQLLLMNPDVLGPSIMPFANYETVMQLATKDALVKTARSAGLAVPASDFYSNANDVDVSTISTFPVVIKPSLSRIWLGDRWLNTTVQIAKNSGQLASFLSQSEWLQHHPFMLQEFIPGYGAGLFALYNKGEAVTFFSHKRVREKPPEGGVSVLSESAPLNPALLDAAKTLLSSVAWHGVAMVEFRVAEDGTPYLMEVNTRFWGSLQLAIDAGVDFPALLFKITNGEAVTPVEDYRIGVRLRWLMGDFDSLYLVLKGAQFSWQQKLKRLISFLMPLPLNTKHEVNRFDDLKPALTELKHYFRNLRQ